VRNLLQAAAIASALALGSCGTTPPTADQIAATIKQICGITVTVADIATLILAGNPLAGGADAWAHLVCDQFKAQQAAGRSAAPGGVIVVNGVPIHYQVP
jgi:hypothetical protein